MDISNQRSYQGSWYVNPNTRTLTSDRKNTSIKDRDAFSCMQHLLHPVEDMARVVRGQVLSLKNQEFVLAARTIGSSVKTILMQHLIPNAMGSILVTVTMLIPSAIFMEAFLGFLGIGLQPPLASLGTMCNDATENLRSCPHQLFIPALVICLIMFAFNFVGDGLRDALDPKLKK